MKNPNLHLIRANLPHGSIKEIAERTNLPPLTVSNFFNRGWYPEHTNMILSEAVEIIKGKYPDADVLDELDSMKLTGGSFIRKRSSKKKSNNPGSFGIVPLIILVGIVGTIAYFISPKMKVFIDEHIIEPLKGHHYKTEPMKEDKAGNLRF